MNGILLVFCVLLFGQMQGDSERLAIQHLADLSVENYTGEKKLAQIDLSLALEKRLAHLFRQLNADSQQSTYLFPQWMMACVELSNKTPEQMEKNWCLTKYFGHTIVIGSLDSPRYSLLLEELAKVALPMEDVVFAPHVNGADLGRDLWSRVPNWANSDPQKKQGIAGCIMAHYDVIKEANEKYEEAKKYWKKVKGNSKSTQEELARAEERFKKYSSVLIMEDNNAFGRLDSEGQPYLDGLGEEFRQVMQQLPEDWDMFYFLCIHGPWGKAKEVGNCPLLLKSVYGTSTKCYALHAKCYGKVLKAFEKALTGKGELVPVDHLLASTHQQLNVYMPKLPLAYRFASPSLVGGGGDAASHWQTNPY